MTHKELLEQACVVIASTDHAIYYKDGSVGVAELYDVSVPGDVVLFDCDSVAKFQDLIEQFKPGGALE